MGIISRYDISGNNNIGAADSAALSSRGGRWQRWRTHPPPRCHCEEKSAICKRRGDDGAPILIVILAHRSGAGGGSGGDDNIGAGCHARRKRKPPSLS
jgi:hypothetical protein